MSVKLTDLEFEEIEQITDSLLEGEESGGITREDYIITWSIDLDTES